MRRIQELIETFEGLLEDLDEAANQIDEVLEEVGGNIEADARGTWFNTLKQIIDLNFDESRTDTTLQRMKARLTEETIEADIPVYGDWTVLDITGRVSRIVYFWKQTGPRSGHISKAVQEHTGFGRYRDRFYTQDLPPEALENLPPIKTLEELRKLVDQGIL
ncbi:MAG: hypothetical protein PHI12_11745 [Dehalococcoidales bacterium]|nr:hypothetical protein [Dehalococcoidales bacterium]